MPDPRSIDAPDAAPLPPIRGRVAFETVTFRYFGAERPVLQDVEFAAEPGQTVALLGMTGSGKSTIINLIPRFYDVSDGRVTIDGHDVRRVTLESLRAQIGIVLQETTLFSGTIRDNIAFGRPDAPLDQVIEAARAAAAHDFILSFPDGYDTLVGERGTTLSGGQKQRIAIARALLLDPRILILDDSTSSVDLQTEFQIQQALDRLMKGRTSFVIAQRISTVVNADQILVLDRGRIAARGTHEELLELERDLCRHLPFPAGRGCSPAIRQRTGRGDTGGLKCSVIHGACSTRRSPAPRMSGRRSGDSHATSVPTGRSISWSA